MQLILLGLAWLCAHAMGFYVSTGQDEESVNIYCEPGEILDNFSFLHNFSHWKIVSMRIKDCPLPPVSFASTLKKHDVNVSNLETLILMGFTTNTSLVHPTLFERLSIKTLALLNAEISIRFHKNVLKPLTSLKKLRVERMMLPPLPDTNQLELVSLARGESIGEWGGCAELSSLKLSEWVVPATKTSWLGHCPKLKKLWLDLLAEPAVNRTLTGARTVTLLILEECSVPYLSKNLLADAVQLRLLKIDNHYAERVDVDFLKDKTQLEGLFLEEVHSRLPWEMARMVHQAKALRELTININDFDFCGEFNQLPPLPLERLILRVRMFRLCLSKWTSLTYLDLDPCCREVGYSFRHLYEEMPIPHDHPIVINHRRIVDTLFLNEEYEYQGMLDKFAQADNVTMMLNLTLDCDCQNGQLARALRSLAATGQLSVQHARCSESGKLILDVPPEHLECNKTEDGKYIIRKYWNTSHIEADCRGSKLRSLPPLPPAVHTLLASENYIDTLQQGFNRSLMVVDLHDNRINSISVAAAHSLFSNPARNVSLASNPLVCNCDNEKLIKILIAHQKQILDFNNMTCIVNWVPVPLRLVDLDDLCRAQRDRDRKVLVIATTIGSLLAVMAFLAIFCYRYWREVKIYLYARGWCLCFVREDELNSDCPYDAFISFAHGDDEFVAEHLLPGLEREPHLKLCMHTRDWIPGEMITTQIERSVELSRRTVVLLSRNFVRSLWGMTEFRTAHMRSMREGRVRLVVIVLDDVLESEDLDADLRRYLRTSTYLRWNDPWFWQRLMFALPHRRSGPQPPSTNRTGGSDVPPAEPALSRAMQMLSRDPTAR